MSQAKNQHTANSKYGPRDPLIVWRLKDKDFWLPNNND